MSSGLPQEFTLVIGKSVDPQDLFAVVDGGLT